MKIVLINLPNPALAEPWTNFPLGLGYVAAAIERRGYSVEVVDLCEGINLDLIPEADIYGMQITAPQAKTAKQLATLIKVKHPNSLVVAGGPQTKVDSSLLAHPAIDSMVIDEGEFSFYELIRQYECTGEVEWIYQNPPIKLLDDIPFPARHLFPNFLENARRTHQLFKGDYAWGGQTTIIASRGCPWACSFCAPHSRKLRFRSPKNVVAELRHIIETFGIYQFKWQDDTFCANKRWVLDLCDRIHRELPRTYHRAHTRVDTFDDDMAASMYRAGFRILCFGIESFSQRVLDLNSKSIAVDQVERALKIAKRNGFKTVGFLIFGMPGENRESVDTTKAGILRNKKYLDYLNLATMTPLPGTPIYEEPERFGCWIVNHETDSKWIVNHDHDSRVMVVTNGLTIEQMGKLKTEMYAFMRNEGYSRPEWKKSNIA